MLAICLGAGPAWPSPAPSHWQPSLDGDLIVTQTNKLSRNHSAKLARPPGPRLPSESCEKWQEVWGGSRAARNENI